MQIIADASGNLIHASVISVYFCLLCCYNSQPQNLCLGKYGTPYVLHGEPSGSRQHGSLSCQRQLKQNPTEPKF